MQPLRIKKIVAMTIMKKVSKRRGGQNIYILMGLGRGAWGALY